MEWTADLGGNLAARARENVDALKAQKAASDEATAALGRYKGAAGAIPAPIASPAAASPLAPSAEPAKRGRGRPRKTPAAAGPAVGEETADFTFMKAQKASSDAAALKGRQAATEAYYAKVRAGESAKGKASAKNHGAAMAQMGAQSSRVTDLAKGAALAGGAALGVAGAGGLTKLALGYKGVMALQGVSYRLGLSFRSLFSGINPAPVVRAATAFADQFKKTSVLGHALEGLFTRSFGTLFAGVEKATPYAIAFTQGVVLGFLHVENAILRARLAVAPYTAGLEKAMGATDGLAVAADLGVVALGGIAIAAAAAAAPFLPYAAAIGAVVAALGQLNALQKEWDNNSGAQIWAKLKQDLGGAATLPKGMTTGAEYDKLHPATASPKAATASMEAGKQIAAGVAKGMDAGAPEVAAAGGRLAGAADKGIRTKAKINSPSRMTEEDGRHMGDGAIRGLDKSGPGVQAAAERNLVPNVAGMGGGAGARGAGGGTLALHFTGPLVQVTSSGAGDIEAALMRAMPRVVDELARLLSIQLGVPVGP